MAYGRPSPIRFAAAIAERLDTVVPAGLRVRAEGYRVHLYSGHSIRGGSENASLLMEEDGRTVDELVETSAVTILNSVQTDLMEHLREQWPIGEGNQAAEPSARVENDRLLMWFGDETRPVITLPPLLLIDLVDGAA
jgi:hypothetical protein